jgi:hypothetical protein
MLEDPDHQDQDQDERRPRPAVVFSSAESAWARWRGAPGPLQPVAAAGGLVLYRDRSTCDLIVVNPRFWDPKSEKIRCLPNWTNFKKFGNFRPGFTRLTNQKNCNLMKFDQI